jgi:hypothetical protein
MTKAGFVVVQSFVWNAVTTMIAVADPAGSGDGQENSHAVQH